MSRQNQPEFPSKVYAEAVVRSATGASLLRSSSLVTSENVVQFQAEPNLVTLAAERLEAEGFEILEIGKASISIAAKREVYERSFRTTLEAVERPMLKEMGEPNTATFINSVDDKPFGEIDTSDTRWDEILDGIALSEPVYYTRPISSTTEPPERTAKYLNVPDDVAQGLNAIRVHQNGITGKGVRVVMIDSGWYPHPFFREHNYKVNVVLAPGSTAPDRDDSGHGTGESANVFAIAPEAELTMIKFDMELEGKLKNVTSVAALKRAIEQRPDIISCSWGSDQRSCQLSPQDKMLAAVVARAVREGIVVIFSAGNGHYGFPAQHPDAIAVGGVYKHLEGSLKGLLEASNYASSFVSPVYQGRQVPDICGLVGQLPYGAYIRLPVPPRSQVDQGRSAAGDGTLSSDGWAVFSGTSAAAPQIAGICALLKQLDPNLSPARVKEILQQTALDVTEGYSNPSTGGASARAGPDLATGYGLADAYEAIEAIKAFSNEQCCADCGSSARTEQNLSDIYLTSKERKPMSSEFPKLSSKLDEILYEFEKILEKKIENQEIEEVELKLTEANFIPRSPRTNAILSLVNNLNTLKIANKKNHDRKTKLECDEIKKKHVLTAKSLLKVQKYKELATRILIAAMDSSDDSVSEAAIEALGEFGSENLAFKLIDIPSTIVDNDENNFHETAIINNKKETVTKIDAGDNNLPITVKFKGRNYRCHKWQEPRVLGDCKLV